jgi:hypothetical protein
MNITPMIPVTPFQLACPECAARPGEHCESPLNSHHDARVRLAAAINKPEPRRRPFIPLQHMPAIIRPEDEYISRRIAEVQWKGSQRARNRR